MDYLDDNNAQQHIDCYFTLFFGSLIPNAIGVGLISYYRQKRPIRQRSKVWAYLKVAVDHHNRHEADTGRAVGEHQEEVDPAQAVTENPVTPEQGIDP